jgi:hypothetical protein
MRCINMKIKKIGIVVFAAVVLMAMTVGTACASTYTYSGTMKTTFSGSSVSVNSQASGFYYVNTNDNVQWVNVFVNNAGSSGTAIVSALPYGLNYKEMSWTIYPGTSGQQTYWTTVSDGSSAQTIHATHTYVIGGYYTSPDCTSMSFA